jgi:hypothetical protein
VYRRIAIIMLTGMLVAGCSPSVFQGGSTVTTSTSSTSAAPTTAGATTRPSVTTTIATTTTEASVGLEAMGVAAGPGVAWLSGSSCGLTVIDAEGTFHAFPDDMDTPIGRVWDITASADGVVYLAAASGVFAVDGSDWTEIEGERPSRVAYDDATGDLWGSGYQVAMSWDGAQWTEFSSSNFGEGDYVDSVVDLAVAPNGDVWVVTRSTAARYDGTEWAWWGVNHGFPESLSHFDPGGVAVDSNGGVWVGTGMASLLHFDGTVWSIASLPQGLHWPRSITASADGRILVTTSSSGLGVLDDRWSTLTAGDGGVYSDWTRAALVDGRARIWVGYTWGFSILDEGVLTPYTLATSGLAGDCVEEIYVAGDGPDVPPPTAPRVGSLMGRLLDGGVPAEGHRVVLCSDTPAMLYSGATPCDGYVFVEVAVTDSQGRYAFADVPVATYDMAWEVEEGSWRGLLGGLETVREGETTHVADFDLADD